MLENLEKDKELCHLTESYQILPHKKRRKSSTTVRNPLQRFPQRSSTKDRRNPVNFSSHLRAQFTRVTSQVAGGDFAGLQEIHGDSNVKTLEEWGMLLLSKKNVRKNHRKTIEFVPSTKLKPIQFNESVVMVQRNWKGAGCPLPAVSVFTSLYGLSIDLQPMNIRRRFLH